MTALLAYLRSLPLWAWYAVGSAFFAAAGHYASVGLLAVQFDAWLVVTGRESLSEHVSAAAAGSLWWWLGVVVVAASLALGVALVAFGIALALHFWGPARFR